MSVKAKRLMIATLALIAMLYGFWDLLPAAPPDTPLKTVYTHEYAGGRPLSGVNILATLVVPFDSLGVLPYNTISGTVYSTSTPFDSTQSGSDGKLTVRLPLTSDIAPTGCRWRLTATYKGAERWSVLVTTTDTTTACLQKVTGQTTTCVN